mgnify:CR=1 FL=1
MAARKRLEPLKRGTRKRRDSWANVQAPHPGVRDPRSVRMGAWPPMVNAAIIASCAFITAIAVLSASLASPVGRVDRWGQWTSESGAIRLEHPSGWAVRDVGSAGRLHVVIMRSQWVRIHVISEGGLVSAAGVYGQIGTAAGRYRALEMVHQQTADVWERQIFGELEEGQMGHTTIGGHSAVWSQFKYRGGYLEKGQSMVGYRATILGPSRGVIAGAVAPSEYWDEFKPIALHVLKSIRFGGEAG